MSLLRLLRAGKSLVGRESSGHYRLLNGPALPKFGSDKNPFREPARTRQSRTRPEMPATVAAPVESSNPEPMVAPSTQPVRCESSAAVNPKRKTARKSVPEEKHSAMKAEIKTAAAPDSEPASSPNQSVAAAGNGSAGSETPRHLSASPKKTVVAATASVLKAGARAAARLAQLNSKLNPVSWRTRAKGGARALPFTDKAMVQGELSLDRVKVVRNDLSDSDLEIVPAKKPTQVPLPAPVLATAEKSPEGAWGRMTGRLFGAGKS